MSSLLVTGDDVRFEQFTELKNKYPYLKIVTNDDGNGNDNRMTAPLMTKYQYAVLKGIRVRQLYADAKPLVEVNRRPGAKISMEDIADMEIRQKKLNLILFIMNYGAGWVEVWHSNELEVVGI